MEELFKPHDMKEAEPLELAKAIIQILDEKKATDIKLLRVSDSTVLTDYFVICTGHSNTQITSNFSSSQASIITVSPNSA